VGARGISEGEAQRTSGLQIPPDHSLTTRQLLHLLLPLKLLKANGTRVILGAAGIDAAAAGVAAVHAPAAVRCGGRALAAAHALARSSACAAGRCPQRAVRRHRQRGDDRLGRRPQVGDGERPGVRAYQQSRQRHVPHQPQRHGGVLVEPLRHPAHADAVAGEQEEEDGAQQHEGQEVDVGWEPDDAAVRVSERLGVRARVRLLLLLAQHAARGVILGLKHAAAVAAAAGETVGSRRRDLPRFKDVGWRCCCCCASGCERCRPCHEGQEVGCGAPGHAAQEGAAVVRLGAERRWGGKSNVRCDSQNDNPATHHTQTLLA